jgi:hypothetical protein
MFFSNLSWKISINILIRYLFTKWSIDFFAHLKKNPVVNLFDISNFSFLKDHRKFLC